ncbi:MAG: hypothetical protein GPJ52_10785 [Candidatus Heimdallarchaeota archaeon]|nr:hypothetical protein [Candidatus Heimdallarchaeota archaeon]
MIRKRKQSNNHNNHNSNGPYTHLSENYPTEINEMVSDLISMRGILRLDILTIQGELIFCYNRWGESAETLNEHDALELLESLKNQLQKANKKEINHFIIRAEDANYIAFSNEKIYLFLQCDKKSKLPFITLKAKRIASDISLLL